MIYFGVNASGFQKAMRDFAAAARKDISEVVKDQAGILLGHVIAITPPAAGKGQAMTDRGTVTLEAKKRGEAQIASDIRKLFPTTTAKEEKIRGWIKAGVRASSPGAAGSREFVIRDLALDEGRISHVHKLARNRRSGRTSVVYGAMMAWSRGPLVKAYIRKRQAQVGLLASGWIAAAIVLKSSARAVPAWIKRHGSRGGSAKVSETQSGTTVEMRNDQDWFPGDMERRVALAANRRRLGLEKATEAILARRAAKATEAMK